MQRLNVFLVDEHLERNKFKTLLNLLLSGCRTPSSNYFFYGNLCRRTLRIIPLGEILVTIVDHSPLVKCFELLINIRQESFLSCAQIIIFYRCNCGYRVSIVR